MILSICIATLPKRHPLLASLLRNIISQIGKADNGTSVEILTNDSTSLTTGAKRKLLYQLAKGKYICSIDDDDYIYPYYISEILKATENNPDAIGMNGIITTDGRSEKKWFISMKNNYEAVKRGDGSTCYSRYHNHLSPIRAEIAKQFPFIDATRFEDADFAKRVHDSGLIKTETCIGTTLEQWLKTHYPKTVKPMYHYKYISAK
jgi:glycosyltransferase involved in cell wall biosynthesis